MGFLVEAIANIAPYIYATCGLLALFQLYRTWQVRAERRHRELRASGEAVGYEQVVGDMIRRDKMDSGRDDSPLRPAEGAVILDTDGLSVDKLARKIAGAAARAGWKS